MSERERKRKRERKREKRTDLGYVPIFIVSTANL